MRGVTRGRDSPQASAETRSWRGSGAAGRRGGTNSFCCVSRMKSVRSRDATSSRLRALPDTPLGATSCPAPHLSTHGAMIMPPSRGEERCWWGNKEDRPRKQISLRVEGFRIFPGTFMAQHFESPRVAHLFCSSPASRVASRKISLGLHRLPSESSSSPKKSSSPCAFEDLTANRK
jgi:hypothetical protein